MLISDDYLQQQRELHQNPYYGTASMSMAPFVARLINSIGYTELLDYGCGKGRLAESLEVDHPVQVTRYDPAIADFSEPPEPKELVACIDVLEHIEPDCLEAVLTDLKRVTLGQALFSIACGPAKKALPDGRNAHLIQERPMWWLNRLEPYFELELFQSLPANRFFVVVTPKQSKQAKQVVPPD